MSSLFHFVVEDGVAIGAMFQKGLRHLMEDLTHGRGEVFAAVRANAVKVLLFVLKPTELKDELVRSPVFGSSCPVIGNRTRRGIDGGFIFLLTHLFHFINFGSLTEVTQKE